MTAVVEELMASPVLPEIVSQLQARLAEERVRREQFYAEITGEEKTEFINGQVVLQAPATVRQLEVRDNRQVRRDFLNRPQT
ncbi:MAG: hypothetical protein FJ399_12735 [Verrucomicrobia bacterium]|nr:hypothetical protein [Verrucomicrobiota bacterium]